MLINNRVNNFYLYIHRVKGVANISPTTPIKSYTKRLFDIEDKIFQFSLSNKTHCDFSRGYHYRLIDVRVKNNGMEKHFAYIDDIKNRIYFDGFMPFRRIEDLKKLFKSNNIHVFYSDLVVDYVEICCRYEKDKIEKVNEALSRLVRYFNTNKTDPMDRMISDGDFYSRLVRNLYDKKHFFNLKNYLYVENFKGEDQEIGDDRLPKLEIQVKKSKSIENALEIGLPIIKSLIDSLNLRTVEMNRDFEKNDYQELIGSEKYDHSEKILFHLNSNVERHVLPILPTSILNDKLGYKLISYLWYKGASLEKICAYLKVSQSTFNRVLRRLGNIVEKRGSVRSGLIYQVDHIELNNIMEN